MKIKQYRPSFVTGFENEISEFNSLKELLEIDWIKQNSNNDEFHRFSLIRDYKRNRHTLMIEYEQGYVWFVKGFIEEDNIEILKDLPDWEPKERMKK